MQASGAENARTMCSSEPMRMLGSAEVADVEHSAGQAGILLQIVARVNDTSRWLESRAQPSQKTGGVHVCAELGSGPRHRDSASTMSPAGSRRQNVEVLPCAPPEMAGRAQRFGTRGVSHDPESREVFIPIRPSVVAIWSGRSPRGAVGEARLRTSRTA